MNGHAVTITGVKGDELVAHNSFDLNENEENFIPVKPFNQRITRQRRKRLLSDRVTEADLKSLYYDGSMYGIKYTLQAVQATLALVLADKLDFTPEQVATAMEATEEYFVSVAEEFLTIEDIKETVKEELNIDVERVVKNE